MTKGVDDDQLDPTTSPESESSTSKPSVPKWELNARDRITSALKKIPKSVEALKARDAVEADTRLLVTDVLCDLLGFDKYEDLTAE